MVLYEPLMTQVTDVDMRQIGFYTPQVMEAYLHWTKIGQLISVNCFH